MDQTGGYSQPPMGYLYGSGPLSGAPGRTPLPNGQPPRPMSFPQQRPPQPGSQGPAQPPVNGNHYMQQRPPMQQPYPQAYPSNFGPPKPNDPSKVIASPNASFLQARPPGYQTNSSMSAYQNGFTSPSGPAPPGQPRAPTPQFAPQGPPPQQGFPPRGPLQQQAQLSNSSTPTRGSPLPPSTGSVTPRDPVSACSSRNPSPSPVPRFEQVEGQVSRERHPPCDVGALSSPLQQHMPPIVSPTSQASFSAASPVTAPATSQFPPAATGVQRPPHPGMAPPAPLMGGPPAPVRQPMMPPAPQFQQPGGPPPPQQQHPGFPPRPTQPSQHPGMPPLPQQQQQRPGMPPLPQQQPQYPGMPPPLPNQQAQQQGMPPFPQQQPAMPRPAQDHMSRRYPTQPSYGQQPTGNSMDGLSSQMGSLSVAQMGYNKLWQGMDCYDLMQTRNILPPDKVTPPKICLHQNLMESANCSPDVFRCTLTKIPESNSLLQKARLPLGILIHPFKDLSQLPVIQCNTIVRCRACRTYINPFVYFVDHRRWKCNLCFRVNELPEEFQYDPVSKTYGDPSRRPEIKTSTIEFIAPSEYMLRPPQPAAYLFVLEVSRAAAESGYLRVVCETLLEELSRLPGDSRTRIGFITFDSALHFYNLAEGLNQPHMMVVGDVDDVFLPCPDNLMVNLHESLELVRDLLKQLPTKFVGSTETGSALGAALQASFKLMVQFYTDKLESELLIVLDPQAAMGGRVTVFQVTLPNCGPGGLQTRGPGVAKDASPLLNPATDFYKRLALDCSGQQIAVDLFLLNSQFADLSTLSGISRYSGGCIQHFPDYNAASALHTEALERSFRRYLTRKIGFEAVMRVRCTRGLAIHTFHGNFFVRSTDLLSLPNVNPDAGFGMQVSIEENLSDVQNVCFQAALLYTSSKGERRIRVHTLCLPIAANVSDILNSADQQCIVGLLAKMAVDRSQLSSLSDARDAFINVAVDVLSTYRTFQSSGPSSGLLAPHSLRLLPLYILALLKHSAFRSGQSVRVDDRLFSMCQMKSLPLTALIQSIYPDLYPVHCLTDDVRRVCEFPRGSYKVPCFQGALEVDGKSVPQPPRLHLSSEKLDSRGLFLLDAGDHLVLYAGRNIAPELCQAALGVPMFEAIPEDMMDLPELETPESERLRSFVSYLQGEKPFPSTLLVVREDSKYRGRFIQHLLEDRSEAALSYYEFLQHLKSQVK